MKAVMLALPLTLIAPLGLLAACDSSPSVEVDNAKPSEVDAKVRAASGGSEFVRPGKWMTTITIDEINIPGMPPEFTAKMKEQQVASRPVESCLTAEQAKKPKEGVFAGIDKSCRYDHFKMDDGKIEASMRCNQNQTVQTMTMTGTYSPDRYDMRMASEVGGTGPQSGTTMKMKVEAKRVGDCDAATAGKTTAK